MNADFTIIVTSYNRPRSLKRTLEHLYSYEVKFNLIIADSSEDLSKDLELQNLINKKKILVKSFNQEISVVEKIVKTLEIVKTKYCVLCPDDDFLIPTSIVKCIDFLEKNHDYSCCHGKYFVHSNFINTKKFGIFFNDLSKKLISSEQPNPVDRIKSYLSGKLANQYTFYAVFKTVDHKKIWNETLTYANNWIVNEYTPCLISLMIGKMKTLPIFYMSREPNSFNWITKEKIIKALAKDKNLFLSEGLIKNLEFFQNLENENKKYLKSYFYDFFEKYREVSLKNSNQINSIIQKNIFLKKILKPFYYFFLKIKFKKLNLLQKREIKNIQDLILNYKNIDLEINNSRKKYET